MTTSVISSVRFVPSYALNLFTPESKYDAYVSGDVLKYLTATPLSLCSITFI